MAWNKKTFFIAGVFLASVAAHAEGGGLSALISRALDHNPEIFAARHKLAASRERIPQAGAWDDPNVFFMFSDVPVDNPSFSRTEMSGKDVGIMQRVPISGKKGTEKRIAGHQSEATDNEYKDTVARVVYEIKDSYYDLAYIDEAISITARNRKVSEGRRNKFLMHEAMASKGIRSIFHFKSGNASKIIEWAKKHDVSPVVIKPLNSGGTDHVKICHSEGEILDAFHAIFGQRNVLDLKNDAVLAQEYIQGDEYVVNMVSARGKHFNTSIWKYHKKRVGGNAIYDLDELVVRRGDVEKKLIGYAKKVLDALEIKYGPSHIEIMMDELGPVLIEIGARIDGMENVTFNRNCIGYSQAEMAIESYLDPESTAAKFPEQYSAGKYGCTVSLISGVEGRVKEIRNIDEIKGLPSFQDIWMKVETGGDIHRTVDLLTSPALVFLAHADEKTVLNDYSKIRMLEGDLFEVES